MIPGAHFYRGDISFYFLNLCGTSQRNIFRYAFGVMPKLLRNVVGEVALAREAE